MVARRPVLVIVEHDPQHGILAGSLECIAAGRKAAAERGAPLIAMVLGSEPTQVIENLRHYPLDTLYVADDAVFETYAAEPYVYAFDHLQRLIDPALVLMADTPTALDLAPRIALAHEAGLITGCTNIQAHSGELLFAKPIYSGNVIAVFGCAADLCVITLRPRSVDPASRVEGTTCEVISLDLQGDCPVPRTEIIEQVCEDDDQVKLDQADIVVSGGRGVGGPEGFTQLHELARVLGAAVGASRPAVDAGWAPSNCQVGQTGHIVAPKLYIAVGISGAVQHIAGMSGSRTVVAVNKNPEANIFKVADYGVVGDQREVIPAFREAL